MRPADRTLVAIARALHGREQFHEGVLVLDEPTARLPEPEVEMLVETLRGCAAQGQTIVYVSHRLEEVFALAQSVTVLRDGRVAASRPLATLDERELIALIVGRAVAETEPMPARELSPAPLLELRGVHAGPLRDVSLTLSPGEVLGVAGLVGSGRTSLLEAIYGALPVDRGGITVDGQATQRRSIASAIRRGLGYVPEDRAAQAAFLSLGIPENLSASGPGRYFRGLWFRHRAERRDAAAAIARFGIRTPTLRAPLSVLSGGNQQKVVVARWLQRSPRLLLLDEPTQGVDVGARADIYAHIRTAVVEDGAAAIVVSSDFDELLVLADRILVLVDGRMAGEAETASIDRHWIAERVYAVPEEVAA
jgi:ribose transport system ATP-binding protein